ncbi:internal virion protein [Pseudoalteromonas phage PH1]|uniref:internal virion protein n=1 Tax=Pseudoalteromonas phage PH1 TaxID=1874540 RepID=UPI0008199CF0|nr:internal virion protein [Pseudoalteromonas phage PH1]ANY29558.1 hypothetical protein [Pseudoalteromonas phage PH1]
MKIQTFDGGLSTRIRPQFLELSQAVEYTNIDNSLGTLTSVKTKAPTTIPAGAYNYYFDKEDKWFTSDIRRDYVPFQGSLYWTDGQAPKAYRDGVTTNLGIVGPTVKPEITTNVVLDNVTTARFQVNMAGNLPLEKVYYKLVNFDNERYSRPRDFTVDLSNSRAELLLELEREDYYIRYEDRRDRFSKRYPSISATAPTTGSVNFNPPEGLDYGSGGIKLYRQYNNQWHLVGTMTDPGEGPIQGLTDDVYNISSAEELDESKIATLEGDYQYVYTFYNSSKGTESIPSPISDTLEVQGEVQLAGMEVSVDPQVDKKRIYRVGGYITTFTLVDTVDNATTDYLDRLGDTKIDGHLLSSTLNTEAPTNLQHLTEANAMLFAAEGSKLRFTPVGKPEYWPEVYYIDFYTDITGLAATGSGVLVFTLYKTYIVYGTGPTLLSQQLLDGEQGCVSGASIQQLGSAAVWLSTDGICISNGSPAQVITQDRLGKVDLDVVDSVIHDQVYYLLDRSGLILAHDYRFETIYKHLELGVTSLTRSKDTLYGIANGVLNELFAGEELEEFTYVSPSFIEGRISEDKTYKKVYVYSKGDIIINIFINDSLVATKTLSGEAKHEIQVPQSKQRGNYIQFKFIGKGEVSELEYVVGRGHGHA